MPYRATAYRKRRAGRGLWDDLKGFAKSTVLPAALKYGRETLLPKAVDFARSKAREKYPWLKSLGVGVRRRHPLPWHKPVGGAGRRRHMTHAQRAVALKNLAKARKAKAMFAVPHLRSMSSGRPVSVQGVGMRRHHKRRVHPRGMGFWSDFADGFKKGFTGVFKAAAPIAGLIPETKGLAPVFSAIGSLGGRARKRKAMSHAGHGLFPPGTGRGMHRRTHKRRVHHRMSHSAFY